MSELELHERINLLFRNRTHFVLCIGNPEHNESVVTAWIREEFASRNPAGSEQALPEGMALQDQIKAMPGMHPVLIVTYKMRAPHDLKWKEALEFFESTNEEVEYTYSIHFVNAYTVSYVEQRVSRLAQSQNLTLGTEQAPGRNTIIFPLHGGEWFGLAFVATEPIAGILAPC